MTTSPPPDLEGLVVADRFRIERLLGQGGMGSVWSGRHLTLGQMVAVKFVHPKLAGSAEARRRFDTEAKAAARIKSRHAVAVFDHGVTPQGQPYIVMEYLEGESLEVALRRRGALPLAEVIEIVMQAARALEVAHAAGVVHRDLKPDNIFLARDAEAKGGYTVKLVDFGIAKLTQDKAAGGAAATQAGDVLGTPHYMSPETMTGAGEVSPASDLWSLGACAFVAATGRVPFEGEAIGDVVLKVCSAPLPVPSLLNAKLPRAFDDWFEKACRRDPTKRFASVREMAEALGGLEQWAAENVAYELRPKQQSALELTLDEPRPPTRGLLLAGVLGGIAATVGALGFYVKQRTDEANLAVQRAVADAAAARSAEEQRRQGDVELAKRAAAVSAAPSASAVPTASRGGRRPRR